METAVAERRVVDLTVGELREIIRQVVREEQARREPAVPLEEVRRELREMGLGA